MKFLTSRNSSNTSRPTRNNPSHKHQPETEPTTTLPTYPQPHNLSHSPFHQRTYKQHNQMGLNQHTTASTHLNMLPTHPEMTTSNTNHITQRKNTMRKTKAMAHATNTAGSTTTSPNQRIRRNATTAEPTKNQTSKQSSHKMLKE